MSVRTPHLSTLAGQGMQYEPTPPPIVVATAKPRHRRQQGNRSILPILGVVVAAVLVLVGVGALVLRGDLSSVVSGLGVATPEQRAVRAWLKENLDTPEWEEVRWWPAVNHGSSRNRLLRLKFRTENPFGGISLLDWCFSVDAKSGKVEDHLPWSDTTGRTTREPFYSYALDFAELYSTDRERDETIQRAEFQKGMQRLATDIADGVHAPPGKTGR